MGFTKSENSSPLRHWADVERAGAWASFSVFFTSFFGTVPPAW